MKLRMLSATLSQTKRKRGHCGVASTQTPSVETNQSQQCPRFLSEAQTK
jgi:hypothetical protein